MPAKPASTTVVFRPYDTTQVNQIHHQTYPTQPLPRDPHHGVRARLYDWLRLRGGIALPIALAWGSQFSPADLRDLTVSGLKGKGNNRQSRDTIEIFWSSKPTITGSNPVGIAIHSVFYIRFQIADFRYFVRFKSYAACAAVIQIRK